MQAKQITDEREAIREQTQKRLAQVRLALGSYGPGTSVVAWAAELNIAAYSWRNWERKGWLPRGGRAALEQALAGHARCRSGEVDARKVAQWIVDGRDPNPLPGGFSAATPLASLRRAPGHADAPAPPSRPGADDAPAILSPALPLVDAALQGRADPMHTLRMIRKLLEAGLAAMAVLIVVTPRTVQADGALPHGWRVLAGGSMQEAAPQEEDPVSAINSKKWMPLVLMGRCA